MSKEQPESMQLPTLPFAVLDEFGQPCEDRVRDHFAAAFEELRAQIGQGEPVAWSPALDYPQYEKERVWCNGKPRQEDIDYWEQHGNGITLAYTQTAPKQKPLLFSEIWDNDAIMEVNADARLPFEMIERFVRAIEAAHNIGEKK